MSTPTHRPRPDLAPTSPHAGGDLHTGDLAPRPLPVGGEVTTGSPKTTTPNTPPPRPRGEVNTTDLGTCGRCLRPIHHGQPYMPAIPFLGSWGGFWHRHCPGPLRLLDGAR
jgi:hypothetical protein